MEKKMRTEKLIALEIMDELVWRKNHSAKNNIEIPLPVYFYIKKYGREPYENLNEIAKMYGDNEMMLYQTVSLGEKGLLASFKMELEKQKKLGKEFEGFIHIELDDELDDKEYRQLFRFLQNNSFKYHFLFSMEEELDTERMQRLLEQFFFIRVKSGQDYSVEEQLKIIDDTLNKLGKRMSDSERDCIEEKLNNHEWDTVDNVKQRLMSVVQNCIYNRGINGENVAADDIIAGFEKLEKKARQTIGFY